MLIRILPIFTPNCFLIGFGNVQIQLIIVGAIILLTGLNETIGTSFFLTSAACDFEMTLSDKGLLSGMTFLGVTVSSYFWGFLGDTQGRKFVIMNALALSTFFSLLSVFMKHFGIFVFCRFMVGVLWVYTDRFDWLKIIYIIEFWFLKCFWFFNNNVRLHRWIQYWQK